MINKSAAFRFEIIDNLLSKSFEWSWDLLLEAVNKRIEEKYDSSYCISMSSLKNDVKDIGDQYGGENAGYHILDQDLFKKRPAILKYKDPNFSIYSKKKLSEDNIKELINLKNQLIPFSGSDLLDGVDDLLAKLSIHTDSENKNIISFHVKKFYEGNDMLNKMLAYIDNKQVISFTFKNWNRKPKKVILSPQFLKQHINFAWYVFGHDKTVDFKKDTPRSYPLNMIKNLKVNFDHEYVEPKVDYKEYLEDVISIGVPYSPKLEKIVLGVDRDYVSFLDKNYLHPSYVQNPKGNPLIKDESGKEYVKREMKLVVNKELEKEILKLEDKVFVSEPLHLAEKIKSLSESILKKYKKII